MSRKAIQKKSVTENQSVEMSRLVQLSYEWRNISANQRQLWNNFADTYPKVDKFGNERILSGFNYFVSVNAYRLLGEMGIFDEPPLHNLPESVPSYTVTITANELRCTFAPAWNPIDTSIAVFATLPNNRITTKQRGNYRLIWGFNEPPYSVLDLTAAYVGYFGQSTFDTLLVDPVNVGIILMPISSTSFLSAEGNFKVGAFNQIPPP